MIVELRGLQLHGFHGAEEQEKEGGQTFLYDIALEVGDRGASDRLVDAVDYTQVAAVVRELNQTRHVLLEALATSVADTLLERFKPEWVRVRVRKPDVHPAGIDVEFSAVTVNRP